MVHDFLTSKLKAYGFTYEVLNAMNNCLANRIYRTKVDENYTRPLLFNIYICDLFFIEKEVNKCTHSFKCIENKASNVFDWFSKNNLKVNPDKSNLLLTSKEETSSKIEGCIIKTAHPKNS